MYWMLGRFLSLELSQSQIATFSGGKGIQKYAKATFKNILPGNMEKSWHFVIAEKWEPWTNLLKLIKVNFDAFCETSLPIIRAKTWQKYRHICQSGQLENFCSPYASFGRLGERATTNSEHWQMTPNPNQNERWLPPASVSVFASVHVMVRVYRLNSFQIGTGYPLLTWLTMMWSSWQLPDIPN